MRPAQATKNQFWYTLYFKIELKVPSRIDYDVPQIASISIGIVAWWLWILNPKGTPIMIRDWVPLMNFFHHFCLSTHSETLEINFYLNFSHFPGTSWMDIWCANDQAQDLLSDWKGIFWEIEADVEFFLIASGHGLHSCTHQLRHFTSHFTFYLKKKK